MKTNVILIFVLIQITTPAFAKREPIYYWVNSTKSDTELGTCMQVQTNETINDAEWTDFCKSIKKFEYTPGYIYKIKVIKKTTKSLTKYRLKKVITKHTDSKLRLHDIWVLKSISGINIKSPEGNNKEVVMEVNMSSRRIMGTDGCNSFGGEIKTVSNNEITFSQLLSTRMLCLDMDVPQKFHRAIAQTNYYTISNNLLTLYDNANNELMVFMKVD